MSMIFGILQLTWWNLKKMLFISCRYKNVRGIGILCFKPHFYKYVSTSKHYDRFFSNLRKSASELSCFCTCQFEVNRDRKLSARNAAQSLKCKVGGGGGTSKPHRTNRIIKTTPQNNVSKAQTTLKLPDNL